MITCKYDIKHLECPYCGENETWDIRMRNEAFILVVNDFIEAHRQCEGEYILGLENTKAERNAN